MLSATSKMMSWGRSTTLPFGRWAWALVAWKRNLIRMMRPWACVWNLNVNQAALVLIPLMGQARMATSSGQRGTLHVFPVQAPAIVVHAAALQFNNPQIQFHYTTTRAQQCWRKLAHKRNPVAMHGISKNKLFQATPYHTDQDQVSTLKCLRCGIHDNLPMNDISWPLMCHHVSTCSKGTTGTKFAGQHDPAASRSSSTSLAAKPPLWSWRACRQKNWIWLESEGWEAWIWIFSSAEDRIWSDPQMTFDLIWLWVRQVDG